MNYINEYFFQKHNDEFDEYRSICGKMAKLYVRKKRKLLSTKDEIKDLQQDTILCFCEAMNEFDENKGHFLGLYSYKLKTLEQSFVSRYCGIGMSYQDYLKEKENNKDIIINKMPYFDDYFKY